MRKIAYDDIRHIDIIHPLGRPRCFVFDLQFEFARFRYVKTKASVTPFMYICPPALAHIGLSASPNFQFSLVSIFCTDIGLDAANVILYFEIAKKASFYLRLSV